ncbi:chymotrypsin B-like [Phlebotomus argentipes]|uniref:chymotrypsin B-like n=1 Tax=Phlebotomus argentipes TaxID=94469 RepID=UPI0028935DCD|nr:chymotrypsin B-like [Phlebotomus argentipes]
MKYSPVLLLVFALSVQANPSISNRVINGQPAIPGSAPYHAHILIRQNQDDGARVGSGCLISMTHVLTTAQNVRTFGHWEIGVGSVNRNQLQWSATTLALVHPMFDYTTMNNNIAIIFMVKPFISSIHVQAIPLPLPTDTQAPFPGDKCRFNGFGFTGPTGPFSDQLLMGFKRVTTDQVCAQTYPHLGRFLSNNFCGLATDQSTFCAGDQGTALVGMVRSQTVLVGLASFHSENCQVENPAVFVRVSVYRTWIQMITGI